MTVFQKLIPTGNRILTTSMDGATRIWDAQSGKLVTDPFQPMEQAKETLGVPKWCLAEFSPDGKRIVTKSIDNTLRIWDVSPSTVASPEWFSRVAEAVARQKLNDQGLPEPLSAETSIKMLATIREQLPEAPQDDDWATWGRWFLGGRSTRTISPFSKITIPEYIENRIQEDTQSSLDEAEMLALGNTELLQRIAHAREALPIVPSP